MAKPRKKYRPDPGRKWEHPLCKQAEAAGLERWKVKHFQMMDGYKDGEEVQRMLVTLADVIAPAIKSMEGWDDPDDIGGVMSDAMDRLLAMARNGYRWDSSHLAEIKNAVSCAIQVTNGMPVIETAKAVHWARQVTQQAMEAA